MTTSGLRSNASPAIASPRGSQTADSLSVARGRRLRRRVRTAPPGASSPAGFWFLLPGLLLYAAFVLRPLLAGVWWSFHAYDERGRGGWVGLDNYRRALDSDIVMPAFEHAFMLMLFYTVLPVVLALAIVASLARVRVRGLPVLQAILFLPQVIAPVVVGVSWVAILEFDGPVNGVLRAIGLDSWARAWLGDFTWALPSIGLIGTWIMFGLAMVLLISGVNQIPRSRYEAARVHGAGFFREFTAVTLPGVRNQLAVAMVLSVVSALRTFDLVFVTTQGGPGTSTFVPSYLIYSLAFITGRDVDIALAIAMLLAVVLLVLTAVINRVVQTGTDRGRKGHG